MQNVTQTVIQPLAKTLTCTRTQRSIGLTKQIATSGEGEVWQTNWDGYLAKIYHLPDAKRIRKLEVMVANPPRDPNAHLGHISYAWPQSLLQDVTGKTVGFLMCAIDSSVELLDVYNPLRRQRTLPGFNWLYLHTTAMNIASLVQAIHLKGYVLGDIKPQNILVSNRALPALIDIDSFQVCHPQTGELFLCPVGSEGFTPAELLGKDLAQTQQNEIHDRFRLAVIIHLLLFGDHPFKGRWAGGGESPDPIELVRHNWWCYAPDSLIQPGPLTIPLQIVHPAIQRCFLRCFNDGFTNPSLRPSAEEWVRVLRNAITELKACPKVSRHYYSQHYGRCAWCDRKAKLGVDIFPAPPSLIKQLQTNVSKQTQTVSRNLSANLETARVRLGKQVAKLPVTAQTQQKMQRGLAQLAGQKLARRKTTRKKVAAQPAQAPVSIPASGNGIVAVKSPATLNSRSSQILWKRLGKVLGVIVAVGVSPVAIVALLQTVGMAQGDIGLTAIGIFLSFGLLAICTFWLKIANPNQ